MNSGDPLIACDERSRVIRWNAAATALTGLGEDDVIGLPCWAALDAVDAAGSCVCGPGCDDGRRAHLGRPPPAREAYVRTAAGGRRRVRMSMISLDDAVPARFAIVMQEQGDPTRTERDPATVRLSPRQREVLTLMADGLAVRAVALRLGLSEATVRNYVRRILIGLRCHSELEAVAAARGLGIV